MWHERIDGWNNRKGDARSPWETDYARIIHSASFRRLQGKTQILNLGDSDFYRTRLTHSLEVAQVASGLTRQLGSTLSSDSPVQNLLPEIPLIQAIASTHDLGHPPFGHGGEVALNYCMRRTEKFEAGTKRSLGFEGNGQTLRILSKLEKFSEAHGSNLARRTLLGTLKYPAPYSDVAGDTEPSLLSGPTTVRLLDRKKSKPPKCYLDCERDVVDWILDPLSTSDRDEFTKTVEGKPGSHRETQHKSFDCSIMDAADDVSFGVHDLEDALALRLLSQEQFESHVAPEIVSDYLTRLKERYSSEYGNDIYSQWVGELFGKSHDRKHAISRMVGYLIEAVELEEVDELSEPLLRYRLKLRSDAHNFLKALKELVLHTVILSPSVQHLEFKGQQMVLAVFETFASDPRAFLPIDTQKLYFAADDPLRVICDHVAGMTDEFLLKTYDRLFSPRMGSVFDRL